MDTRKLQRTLERQYGKGQVLITKLLDDPGAVAVLPMRDPTESNAMIFDSAGNTICVIEVPETLAGGNGFSDAYYVNGELTLIYVVPGRDFAVVVDEKSGRAVRVYETR